MKSRSLTEAEQKLWREVTKDVARYQVETVNIDARPLKTDTRVTKSNFPLKKAPVSSNPLSTRIPSIKQPQKPVSVFSAGDPALDKRVRRRRMSVDAVLDLHGMTQVEAEERLRRFITLARHQNARCVLVITGKGVHQNERDTRPFQMHEKPRGVLRSRFIEWVEQSPIRNQISRVSPAKPGDGGRGAFYVFLKRSE